MKQADCPHCQGKGICIADNGKSCGTCMDASKIKTQSEIVKCDICSGYGRAETKSERLMNRSPFIVLLVVLIVFYGYSFWNIDNDQRFDQIFPLIASLTTMIVTFFFARK